MLEMHLRQPRFTYSPCGPFTKTKERIQKFKKTRDSKSIYFQHDMAYGYFRDLPRRTAADKVSHNKHLILLKIQNMADINADLLQWFIDFFL